jgi:hypothetical protein
MARCSSGEGQTDDDETHATWCGGDVARGGRRVVEKKRPTEKHVDHKENSKRSRENFASWHWEFVAAC